MFLQQLWNMVLLTVLWQLEYYYFLTWHHSWCKKVRFGETWTQALTVPLRGYGCCRPLQCALPHFFFLQQFSRRNLDIWCDECCSSLTIFMVRLPSRNAASNKPAHPKKAIGSGHSQCFLKFSGGHVHTMWPKPVNEWLMCLINVKVCVYCCGGMWKLWSFTMEVQ